MPCFATYFATGPRRALSPGAETRAVDEIVNRLKQLHMLRIEDSTCAHSNGMRIYAPDTDNAREYSSIAENLDQYLRKLETVFGALYISEKLKTHYSDFPPATWRYLAYTARGNRERHHNLHGTPELRTLLEHRLEIGELLMDLLAIPYEALRRESVWLYLSYYEVCWITQAEGTALDKKTVRFERTFERTD
jgi:hypothetical protein